MSDAEMAASKSPLEDATAHYEKQDIAAFLGPPSSGKTVIATLIRDALFGAFLRKYSGEYSVDMRKGFDYITKLNNSIRDGKFPPTTPPETDEDVIFSIRRRKGIAGELSLHIRDISGEDYEKLLISHEMNYNERVNSILKWGKLRNKSFGPMSYLIFANKIAIVIDCSKFSEWRKLDIPYSHLLKSLSDFQEAKDGTLDIKADIMVLLTKADTLPENTMQTDIEELLKEHMSQFMGTLQSRHIGKRKFIRLHIDTETNSKNDTDPDKKIKLPLAYSVDHYVKMLEWMIDPSQ